MAGLEGAVVVYLRALYYPDGFSVILKIIDLHTLLVEIVRELMTLIMLASIAYLIGKNSKERFAYFLFTFGVWDIFYYVWLKLFLDWPSALSDWDILFLIPVTWLGPVWAPIVCSITMIYLSMVIIKNPGYTFSRFSISLLIVGSLFILFTFMKDYGLLMAEYGFALTPEFIETAQARIPQPFSWFIFLVGQSMLIASTIKFQLQK